MHAGYRVEELIDAGSVAVYFLRGEIFYDGIAELRGAADAFASEQRNHSVRIVVLDLALLPLLHGPSGFAYMVDGVAKIHEDALVDSAGANIVLEAKQLGTGFLQLKIDTPKGFARDEQLDSYAEDRAFFAANAHHAGAIRFAGEQVGQLQLAADAGKRFHAEQAALRVDFAGLRGFRESLATGVLPFGLHRDYDGKAAAAALVGFGSNGIEGSVFHGD